MQPPVKAEAVKDEAADDVRYAPQLAPCRGECLLPLEREAHAVAFWSVAGPFLAPHPPAAWPVVLSRSTERNAWWASLLQTAMASVVGLNEPRCTFDLSRLRFPQRYALRFGGSMARYLNHLSRAFFARFPEAEHQLSAQVAAAVASSYGQGPPPHWTAVMSAALCFAPRPIPGCKNPSECPCVGLADQSAVRTALYRSFAAGSRNQSAVATSIVTAVARRGGCVAETELLADIGTDKLRAVHAMCQETHHHRYFFPWLEESPLQRSRSPDGTAVVALRPLFVNHSPASLPTPLKEEFPPPMPTQRPLPSPVEGAPAPAIAGAACPDCRAARRNRLACLALGHTLSPGCANERHVVFAPCDACAGKRRPLPVCLAAGHAPSAQATPKPMKGGRRRCADVEPAAKRRRDTSK